MVNILESEAHKHALKGGGGIWQRRHRTGGGWTLMYLRPVHRIMDDSCLRFLKTEMDVAEHGINVRQGRQMRGGGKEKKV